MKKITPLVRYTPEIHRKLYCDFNLITPFKKRLFRVFLLFLPGFDMEEVDKCGASLGQPHPQPRPLHTHNSSASRNFFLHL
jgi:hypothetical protein